MEKGDRVSFYIFKDKKFKLEIGVIKKIRKPNNKFIFTIESDCGEMYYKSLNKLTKLK